MSSQAIKTRYRHPRDYIEPILWRCVRRYGYLNEAWFRNAYHRIQKKHCWHSTAHRHIPQLKQYGMFADGEFVEVDFENPERKCPCCGGSYGYLFRTYAVNPPEERSRDNDIYRIWNLDSNYGRDYQLYQVGREVQFNCKSKNCSEVIKFIQGTHDLIGKAKEIGVSRNLPLTKIKSAQTPGEAFLLSAAAMVDFEARYNDRLTKQSN